MQIQYSRGHTRYEQKANKDTTADLGTCRYSTAGAIPDMNKKQTRTQQQIWAHADTVQPGPYQI